MELVDQAIEKAEGYMELGLTDEAWAVLDELPNWHRRNPLILVTRLKIFGVSQDWKHGELAAEGLVSIHPDKASFWYQLATARIQTGKLPEAREALKKAVELDGDMRLRALEDPLLSAIW